MLNHRQVQAFRAVVLTGSTTAAAGMLNVTQPAVSRLLRDLELDLGLRLFDRSGGRLVPTGDAVTLYREVERSFVGMDRIRRTAEGLRAGRAGSLRIGALPALANGFLPRFLAGFLAEHDQLDMTVFGLSSVNIVEQVSIGQLDVGLVAELLEHPSVVTEPLPPVGLVAVLPPGHRLAARDCLEPADFDGEPFVSLDPATLLRQRIDALMVEHGVRPATRVETHLSVIACALVSTGFALALVDPFTAADYRAHGVVVRRFHPAVELRWGLVYPKFRPGPSILPELVGRLKQAMIEAQVALRG